MKYDCISSRGELGILWSMIYQFPWRVGYSVEYDCISSRGELGILWSMIVSVRVESWVFCGV